MDSFNLLNLLIYDFVEIASLENQSNPQNTNRSPLLFLLQGTMISYLLDSMHMPEAAVFAWWTGLVGMWASVILNTVMLHGVSWFLVALAPTVGLLLVCVGQYPNASDLII
jgi:hypothetical protein